MAVTSGAAAAAGTTAGASFSSRFSTAISAGLHRLATTLKVGLVAGTAAVVAGLGAMAVAGLKSAAAMEQTQIGFEALTGSAQEASKFIAELQQFSAKTPFEFAGVRNAARRILAFGDAVGITREQVIPTLTVIGDLTSVLGVGQQEIDSVVRALGQMASKGKVTQEELLQLAEALPGFNANAAIAAALGLPVGKSMELITKGAVDARTGIRALLDGMAGFKGAAGAMVKQSETLLGVFSTFKDTISIELVNAFQPLVPAVKDALGQLTPILGSAIGQLAPALGSLLSGVLPTIGHLVTGLVPIITPILDLLRSIIVNVDGVLGPLGAAIGLVLEQLKPLGPVIGDTLAVLITELIPVIAELAPVLAELVPPLGELLVAMLPLIPPLGELLVAVVQLLVPLAEFTGWLISLGATHNTLQPTIAALGLLTAGISALAGWLTNIDWARTWQSVTGAVAAAGNAITGFFRDLPGRITGFLRSLPERLRDLALRAFQIFAFAVGFGIGTILAFFRDLPGRVIAHVKLLWERVRGLFKTGADEAKSTVATGVANIVAQAKALPGRVVDAVKALPGLLRDALVTIPGRMYQLGRDIILGLIDGIKSLIGNVTKTLRSGLDSAVDGVKRGLGIASPSKVFAAIGRDTIAGYVRGVEAAAQAARSATMAALSQAGGRGAPAPQQQFAEGNTYNVYLTALSDRFSLRQVQDDLALQGVH